MPDNQQTYYELLLKSQYWPTDQKTAWQRRYLSWLVHHAQNSVPFNRFRLNSILLPNKTIDWDKWAKLPILTRADLSEHLPSLTSTAPVREHGPFEINSTSGSTGHPISIITTNWQIEQSRAANWRLQQWMGVDWSKTIIAKMNPSASTKVGASLGLWGPPWLAQSQSGRLIYTPYAQPLTELIDLIAETDAAYLSVTPCIVEALVETSRNFNKPVHLDSVLLRGGDITDFTTKIVAEDLGARTIGLYSSKEAGAIASPCPSGDGYHVNDESVLVEIVDEFGFPVKPGQEGRVIVTPFASTAVPLLRYDQGDMAVLSEGCSCGRTLMHLKKITGRWSDPIERSSWYVSLGLRFALAGG